MATKQGADGPSNFQSRANFTSVCAQTGLTVSAAAAAPASMPKSLILSMFDAPCEAGRPARHALPEQSPCQPEACKERRQRFALAARLGILLGLAYSQVKPVRIVSCHDRCNSSTA